MGAANFGRVGEIRDCANEAADVSCGLFRGLGRGELTGGMSSSGGSIHDGRVAGELMGGRVAGLHSLITAFSGPSANDSGSGEGWNMAGGGGGGATESSPVLEPPQKPLGSVA